MSVLNVFQYSISYRLIFVLVTYNCKLDQLNVPIITKSMFFI